MSDSKSNTRSTVCAIWEDNLANFEKLLFMIQSPCSIYRHFHKPLRVNINFDTTHLCSAANKYFSSTGHHDQKNKKSTSQI